MERKTGQATYARREEAVFHTSSEYEHYFCSMISSGNVDEIKRLLADIPTGSFVVGRVSDDPARQVRYLIISGTSVILRAAIAGGLSQEEAFHRFDGFIYQLDKIEGIDEMTSLHFNFVAELTESVRKQKNASRNPFVRRAVRYIEYNISKRLTVQEIAEAVKVTPNYLSSLFAKDMGITLTGFITRKKLEEAQYLLLNTNKSCLTISNQLSFASQSYFIIQFKKYYGVTPQEYRMANGNF